MPLTLTDIQTPIAREDARELILELLAEAGFPVEAWQDEGAARAFVEAGAALFAQGSDTVAAIGKMLFLATSSKSFLDAVVQSQYDETRNPAVAAVFTVDLVNSGGVTHIVDLEKVILRASNGETFSNHAAGATVSAGATTELAFRCQSSGAAGNVPAQTLELVTPLAGVSAVFDGAITTVGADAEKDPQYRERARTKWATLQVESVDAALTNRIRTAVPGIFHVGFDHTNPRGPGTIDVYLAGENATAGGSDVTAAQAVLDAHVFGNGAVDVLAKAIAAPTQTLDFAATAYVRGVSAADFETAATQRWRDFLATVPIGGFDLSPGPQNTIEFGQIVAAFASEVDFSDEILSGLVSLEITGPAGDTAVAQNTKVLEGSIAWNVIAVTA